MKSTTIRFCCSLYEKKLLRKRAQRAGLTLSEYCRSSAFGNKIVERLTPEQLDHYKMLLAYNNHFSRIGTMFETKDPRLAREVQSLAREIREHLFNFKK